MIYYQKGSATEIISRQDIEEAIIRCFEKIGPRKKVLAIPPDYTRFHSFAGTIMQAAESYLGNKLCDILPALGTHAAMTEAEISHMYPEVPASKFRVHDWRKDIVTLGEVPGSYLKEVSDGMIDYAWPAQVNRMLVKGGHDLIMSVGQVVPHEVVGMANYNKNIFVGTGGQEGINKSHFLGAVYGMERMMGRADTPVRRVLNYASEHFAQHMPVIYFLTVVSADEKGKLQIRGLYAGDDYECFEKASRLSLEVNFSMLDKALDKVVVYLDPSEYKSTWLGNKSIYRTRMAIADGGQLIVLAPGVAEFGEDRIIDGLIRKYGYVSRSRILEQVERYPDLKANLSAAAHLIHGSSDGRFSITYCTEKLSAEEIRGVGFSYDELDNMLQKYDPGIMKDGFNRMEDGEEVFYISNPALGLWADKSRY